MRKLLLLVCAVGLFSITAMAQKANYSGTWILDKTNSKLEERQRNLVESITLTVAQTDKELKVETATKRIGPNDAPAGPPPGGGQPGGAPPAGGGAGGGAGRGMGGGGGRGFGMGGGGDGVTTYALDGKETRSEVDGPMGKMPVIHKATVEADGSVKLSSSRTFNGPNGEITMTTKETWKLSGDGKTLTVDRESTTPRGSNTSTLVFTKK